MATRAADRFISDTYRANQWRVVIPVCARLRSTAPRRSCTHGGFDPEIASHECADACIASIYLQISMRSFFIRVACRMEDKTSHPWKLSGTLTAREASVDHFATRVGISTQSGVLPALSLVLDVANLEAGVCGIVRNCADFYALWRIPAFKYEVPHVRRVRLLQHFRCRSRCIRALSVMNLINCR